MAYLTVIGVLVMFRINSTVSSHAGICRVKPAIPPVIRKKRCWTASLISYVELLEKRSVRRLDEASRINISRLVLHCVVYTGVCGRAAPNEQFATRLFTEYDTIRNIKRELGQKLHGIKQKQSIKTEKIDSTQRAQTSARRIDLPRDTEVNVG